MTTVSSTTTTTSSSTSSSSSSSSTTLFSDYQTFLTMLTTQLENQDPTDPLDTNQFTSQLVQYASVEQQLKTNDTLSSLLSTVQQQNITQAVGYIGKEITYTGDTAAVTSGESSTWGYSLDSAASSVTLTITNSSGKTVKTVTESDVSSGDHTYTWDGTDDSGDAVSSGDYTISVSATDSSGDAVTTSTSITGTVTGVETVDSDPVLIVGDQQVSISDITAINTTSSSDSSSSSSSTSS